MRSTGEQNVDFLFVPGNVKVSRAGIPSVMEFPRDQQPWAVVDDADARARALPFVGGPSDPHGGVMTPELNAAMLGDVVTMLTVLERFVAQTVYVPGPLDPVGLKQRRAPQLGQRSLSAHRRAVRLADGLVVVGLGEQDKAEFGLPGSTVSGETLLADAQADGEEIRPDDSVIVLSRYAPEAFSGGLSSPPNPAHLVHALVRAIEATGARVFLCICGERAQDAQPTERPDVFVTGGTLGSGVASMIHLACASDGRWTVAETVDLKPIYDAHMASKPAIKPMSSVPATALQLGL